MKIRLRYFLFLLLFCLFSFRGFAGNIIISGHAPDYCGDSLSFYYSLDPFTGNVEIAGSVKVGQDGFFEINFESRIVRQINLDIGGFSGFLFVEPEKEYRIDLPSGKLKNKNEILNPYFKPERIRLGVLNLQEDDLNILMKRFDDLFYPFFNEYALNLYANKQRSSIKKFELFIDSSFIGFDHPFFLEYIRYKLNELQFLQYSRTKKQLIYAHFSSLKIVNNNPAFSELFNRVYKRFLYFFAKISEDDEVEKVVYGSKSYIELKDILKRSTYFRSDSLLELVLIKGIYDELYLSDFPKDNLLALLEGLGKSTSIDSHRQLAAYIKWKITRLDPGESAPGFDLFDSERHRMNLNSLKGKYVYLNFASFQSYACQVQFPMLNKISKKYSGDLVVVSIIVDGTLEDMVAQKELYGYKWVFLHLGNDSALLKQYNVRAFPTYYLIDKHAQFIKAPTLAPSEGFEKYFKGEILGIN